MQEGCLNKNNKRQYITIFGFPLSLFFFLPFLSLTLTLSFFLFYFFFFLSLSLFLYSFFFLSFSLFLSLSIFFLSSYLLSLLLSSFLLTFSISISIFVSFFLSFFLLSSNTLSYLSRAHDVPQSVAREDEEVFLAAHLESVHVGIRNHKALRKRLDMRNKTKE